MPEREPPPFSWPVGTRAAMPPAGWFPPAPEEPSPQPPPDWAITRAALRSQADPALQPPDVGNPAELLANPGAATVGGVLRGAARGSVKDMARAAVKGGWLHGNTGITGAGAVEDVQPMSVVREGPTGDPKRVYHGTPEGFSEFKKRELSKESLFGPGFYFTENPNIASGYAFKNLPFANEKLQDLNKADEMVGWWRDRIERAKGRKEHPRPRSAAALFEEDDAASIPHMENQLKAWEEIQAREQKKLAETMGWATTQTPNVKPAYLNIRRPLDLSKPMTAEAIDHIADVAERAGVPQVGYLRVEAQRIRQGTDYGETTGESIYEMLEEAIPHQRQLAPTEPMVGGWSRRRDKKAIVNRILQRAGYDGLTHMGGARTGNKPHRVWIAFSPKQVVHPFEPMTPLTPPQPQPTRATGVSRQ